MKNKVKNKVRKKPLEKIEKINSAEAAKAIFLDELRRDPFVYLNEHGRLDARDEHEVDPFAHVREYRETNTDKTDVVAEFLEKISLKKEEKARVEAHLRATEFAGNMFGARGLSEIGDSLITRLSSLLFEAYKRGQESTKKKRRAKKRKK